MDTTTTTTIDISSENVARQIAWLRAQAVGDYVQDADMMEALAAERDAIRALLHEAPHDPA